MINLVPFPPRELTIDPYIEMLSTPRGRGHPGFSDVIFQQDAAVINRQHREIQLRFHHSFQKKERKEAILGVFFDGCVFLHVADDLHVPASSMGNLQGALSAESTLPICQL